MAQSAPIDRSRRTQAERRDQSKQGLLLAATEVIAERGVSAATFDAIGSRAGFSRGLATQKFGSKQGMIEALIAHLHARQDEMLGVHGVDGMPGLQAILTYVDLYLRELGRRGENRAYFMLLASAIADRSVLCAAFSVSHERVQRRLEAMVQRGQAEGTIRQEIEAAAAALMIGSLLLGLSIQGLIDPDMDLAPIRTTSLATLRLSFAKTPQG